MSRITRVLLPAVFTIALGGVATSSAFAVEDPFYKLNKVGRLKAGETREVGLKAVGNSRISAPGAGITITCTGLATKPGATINGSEPGAPGTSAGVIEKTGCTVAGNGTKCIVAGGRIVTNPLKDELELGAEKPIKGTKILDLFKPVTGSVIVVIKLEAEAGGECKFKETAVEGSFDVEILNSKKQTVAFEENEAEELFGFVKLLPNGTKECKLKEGKLDKCTTTSIKAFGVTATLEGTDEVFLTGADAGKVFGVFTK